MMESDGCEFIVQIIFIQLSSRSSIQDRRLPLQPRHRLCHHTSANSVNHCKTIATKTACRDLLLRRHPQGSRCRRTTRGQDHQAPIPPPTCCRTSCRRGPRAGRRRPRGGGAPPCRWGRWGPDRLTGCDACPGPTHGRRGCCSG